MRGRCPQAKPSQASAFPLPGLDSSSRAASPHTCSFPAGGGGEYRYQGRRRAQAAGTRLQPSPPPRAWPTKAAPPSASGLLSSNGAGRSVVPPPPGHVFQARRASRSGVRSSPLPALPSSFMGRFEPRHLPRPPASGRLRARHRPSLTFLRLERRGETSGKGHQQQRPAQGRPVAAHGGEVNEKASTAPEERGNERAAAAASASSQLPVNRPTPSARAAAAPLPGRSSERCSHVVTRSCSLSLTARGAG